MGARRRQRACDRRAAAAPCAQVVDASEVGSNQCCRAAEVQCQIVARSGHPGRECRRRSRERARGHRSAQCDQSRVALGPRRRHVRSQACRTADTVIGHSRNRSVNNCVARDRQRIAATCNRARIRHRRSGQGAIAAAQCDCPAVQLRARCGHIRSESCSAADTVVGHSCDRAIHHCVARDRQSEAATCNRARIRHRRSGQGAVATTQGHRSAVQLRARCGHIRSQGRCAAHTVVGHSCDRTVHCRVARDRQAIAATCNRARIRHCRTGQDAVATTQCDRSAIQLRTRCCHVRSQGRCATDTVIGHS